MLLLVFPPVAVFEQEKNDFKKRRYSAMFINQYLNKSLSEELPLAVDAELHSKH